VLEPAGVDAGWHPTEPERLVSSARTAYPSDQRRLVGMRPKDGAGFYKSLRAPRNLVRVLTDAGEAGAAGLYAALPSIAVQAQSGAGRGGRLGIRRFRERPYPDSP
jgi:hypothetical protein